MKVKRILSSHHKEKYFFSISLILSSTQDDAGTLNLSWSSFHDVCKSKHYLYTLNLYNADVNYISIKLEEKETGGFKVSSKFQV